MKVLYALGLILLFVAGLMLAKYNPWTEQNNANLGYANLGGDFILESSDGPVKLQDFRGQMVLMYFGFTSCPEVCPTALSCLLVSIQNEIA
jgi:protein SCO1/2